jgi:hypothetical protein
MGVKDTLLTSLQWCDAIRNVNWQESGRPRGMPLVTRMQESFKRSKGVGTTNGILECKSLPKKTRTAPFLLVSTKL